MVAEMKMAVLPMEKQRELPISLEPLTRVSANFWWSWAADGAAIFRDLDSEIWAQCEQNPRVLLREISDLRLAQMAADPPYLERVAKLARDFDDYLSDQQLWVSQNGTPAITPEHPVAYFCAEFGIHNSLPLYSGGLGILAGDHLKSASDLNVPLVGVGLLYSFGYFRQHLGSDGWQQESYRETNRVDLAIEPVDDVAGGPLMIEVTMRGRPVRAQVWRASVGRVSLYLLDTNIPENHETDRLVTGHLYGGDRETRLVQEMMLGIGGVRLLRALGIAPHVYHLNEGHSAFLTLELAREQIESQGIRFSEASDNVRQSCVFTTHTPVAAGHDEFERPLLQECFGTEAIQALGLSAEEFMGLGQSIPGSREGAFGLTPLALKMCRSTNAVSRKHGEVSRALWQKMWPGRDVESVPITSVTNGVHAATWVAPLIRSLFEKHLGADWAKVGGDAWVSGIEGISNEALWRAHSLLRQKLIAFVRERLTQSRNGGDESDSGKISTEVRLDPNALTIGFARRVAEYKRWPLPLSDPARLARLLNDTARPVQFIFSGKAHPQDQGAKVILQQVAKWTANPLVRHRLAFLEDYDQEIARQLVQSVDVWLNVPRRPFEASGTSGEKVAINGGLNFSVLDGWWLEGYDGSNGFAIGVSTAESLNADAEDAESFYSVLENEILPLYYDRDAAGIPQRWVAMMKRSIATLVPRFNSDRMVAEYAERIYLTG
ncbi:MAG: glycogen phosphorylase [Blastocatellia bacterium]|jgi:starch phosphorylase|nr:glycogen phosphorylase [Blastocatellia bacterium]